MPSNIVSYRYNRRTHKGIEYTMNSLVFAYFTHIHEAKTCAVDYLPMSFTSADIKINHITTHTDELDENNCPKPSVFTSLDIKNITIFCGWFYSKDDGVDGCNRVLDFFYNITNDTGEGDVNVENFKREYNQEPTKNYIGYSLISPIPPLPGKPILPAFISPVEIRVNTVPDGNLNYEAGIFANGDNLICHVLNKTPIDAFQECYEYLKDNYALCSEKVENRKEKGIL